MMQKIVILILSLTVVGAVGVGVYEANQDDSNDTPAVLHDGEPTNDVVAEVVDPTATEAQFEAQLGAPTDEPQVDPTATSATLDMKGQTTSATTAEPVQQMAAVESVGDVWEAFGIITSMNDYGFTLDNNYYVELGPPDFWQAQNVNLVVGSIVQVSGFNNGDQIHARLVTTSTQEQITVRTETGQPLWSGGVDNTNGQDQTHQDGNNVPVSEWETYAGVLNIRGNNNLTLTLNDGTVIDLQMGQPRFWQGQEIELTSGVDVTVMGYWQTTSFRVGTLTKDLTQERLMILDPNGRPLWAGLGNTGTAGNAGNTGTTQNDTTSVNTSTTGNSGQGGNGNGYRGGRN